MVRPIVRDPFLLSRPSLPAAPEDLPAAQDLLDTLRANRETCVGMAANMIGVLRRIVAVDDGGSYLLLFSPEILRAEAPFEAEEGCLSLPGTRSVRRYGSIKVRYCNEKFQVRVRTCHGWTAQILQHEIDHCSGVLV